jgi:hypothetical protein
MGYPKNDNQSIQNLLTTIAGQFCPAKATYG